jgi:hypothetical protein
LPLDDASTAVSVSTGLTKDSVESSGANGDTREAKGKTTVLLVEDNEVNMKVSVGPRFATHLAFAYASY